MKGQRPYSARTAELIDAVKVLQGPTDYEAEDEALPAAQVVRVAEVGALVEWQREVLAGTGGQSSRDSSNWHLDALWRAACCEAAARDCSGWGQELAAADLRQRAALLILGAANSKRPRGSTAA